jgi:hypothetical protein
MAAFSFLKGADHAKSRNEKNRVSRFYYLLKFAAVLYQSTYPERLRVAPVEALTTLW